MKKLTLVFVLTLISAVTVNAAIQPNDREFSVSGRYTHTPDAHNDAGGGGIEASQYVDNNLSIGLQGWLNFGNRGDDTVIGVNTKYHFSPTEEVSPYVGAQINYAMASTTTDYSVESDRSTDGMMWGPIVGVAFKCADKSSIFVQYEYQLYQGGIRSSGIKEGSAVVIGMSWGF